MAGTPPAGGSGSKSLLDQLLEEAAARAKDQAKAEDYAVNLRNAAGDEVTGIPMSQAAGWLHDKFGIGEPPAEEEGAGDGGTKEGTSGAGNVLAHFSRGGKKAAS